MLNPLIGFEENCVGCSHWLSCHVEFIILRECVPEVSVIYLHMKNVTLSDQMPKLLKNEFSSLPCCLCCHSRRARLHILLCWYCRRSPRKGHVQNSFKSGLWSFLDEEFAYIWYVAPLQVISSSRGLSLTEAAYTALCGHCTSSGTMLLVTVSVEVQSSNSALTIRRIKLVNMKWCNFGLFVQLVWLRNSYSLYFDHILT